MENNSSQVVLVKDIYPGISDYGYAYGSFPDNFTEFNNQLYFSADDGENGRELWVSDGTTEGTQLVKDINPGSNDYGNANNSFPRDLTEFNDQLYFTAQGGDERSGLWVSDGTTEGTHLVKDIYPGSIAFYSDSLTEFNDQLYFAAAGDAETGDELWVSDGTTEGTHLVKDIYPGSNNDGNANSSSPGDFTEFNDQLYFTAQDGENGYELWVSDGTTEGTQLVKDIYSGISDYGYANNSSPLYFTKLNDQLYFSASDGDNGRELWVSDGTTEGTQLVKDIYSGSNDYGNAFSSYPRYFTKLNDQLYFAADDAENGRELWVSDGTTEGTHLVKDINPGSNSSYAKDLSEFNDQLYFTADDGENGSELWVSDGTTEGTHLVKDINPGSDDYGYAKSSYPSNFIEFNDQLYFAASDGENGYELWVSDGTTEGTHLVEDINPGSDGSVNNKFTEFNDQLYFAAENAENGQELFKLIIDDSTTTNIITGTNGSDNLIGTDGADQIEGLNGKDTLDGSGGNDTLLGGNGKDNLVGGAGNDLLDGGNGKDILTGGAGEDIFVLRSGEGKDSITDFELGSDSVTVYFSDRLGSAGSEFNDLTFAGNTLKVGDEVLATFTGVDTEQLTAGDFDII